MATCALLGFSLFGLAGCGDDSSSSSGGGGTDESYVAAVCKGALKFTNGITSAAKSLGDGAKPEDEAKAIQGPLDDFIKDLKAAKPPSDVASYHSAFVTALESASKKMKDSKDPKAFDEVKPPESAPDIKARLDKVAANNKDCKDSGFTDL